MHRPLMVVLDTLGDSVLEDKLIAYFQHLTAPFDKGGKSRMTVEVVEIFEDFLRKYPGRFPRTRKYVAARRKDHERGMAQVEDALKALRDFRSL